MDVITAHTNADFDCLGAMVAAARLYPGARICFPGPQEKRVRNFIARYPDYLPAFTRAGDIDLNSVGRLVIVDCQQPDRIGLFSEITGLDGVEIHIYDHHPITPESIKPSGGVIRPCGSVSSIMACALKEQNLTLTPEEATVVMLGIYEDTGRLLFHSTTQDDYLAAAWLLEQGARLNIVADSLSLELSGAQVELLNKLLKNLKTTFVNGIPVSIAHAESAEYIADIAGLAHIIRDMENLDVLFLALAMKGRVYLVARSRVAEVNAGEILKHFQGGGHATAASATIPDQALKPVLERLEALLKTMAGSSVSAGDIMSSPVKTMPHAITINEAHELLTRYNCSAMPVMEKNRMTGIISRKIVENALHHGLGSSPVTDFMYTEFLRATPATLLRDIQEYMVVNNRRFTPVFENERLAGAITRTDLLRQIYANRARPEANFDMHPAISAPKNRSIAGLINKRLPHEVIELLTALGTNGDELGLPVHAVGGFVRDLLLDAKNLDIDVTVEGDGIFFAESFAERHDCRVRSHPVFGTAALVFPGGVKIDVASTRLEYYESPGKLPVVERSSLRHDLYRRDFTINTLAICINKERFGLLTDYFGGRQDIQERVVRVLHNLSFVEDPTRLFRAIRFEQRLGFHIAPHTENLMRTGIRMNVLEKVSGLRLLNELMLIFQEKEPAGAITRMSQLGLLAQIHPALKLVPETARVIHEAAQMLAWFRLLYLKDVCEQWQVYFLALCTGLAREDFEAICQRLDVPGRVISRTFGNRRKAAALLDTIQQRLKRGPEIRPSEIYGWFRGLPLEILLYLAARATREEVRRHVSLYITQLRLARSGLDGTALKALGLRPGPRIGRIKERLLAARLDGTITTGEEELALAQTLINNEGKS